MRNILTLLALVVATMVAGCDAAKDYQAFVQTLYKGGGPIDRADARVICISDMPQTFNSVVRVKRRRVSSLESGNSNFVCDLNPNVPFEIFSKQCQASAQSAGLLDKLGSRKIEIHLLSAPGAFKYVRMTDYYNQVYTATREYSQGIYPVFTKLRFNYQLHDGTTVQKRGEITLEDNGDAYTSHGWDWEPITRKYLSLYEQRLQALTHEGIVKLSSEL